MGNLFTADGIRALVDGYPLDAENTERLGLSIGNWALSFNQKPIFILGSDTRESGWRLRDWLIKGLTYGGIAVVDVGVIPTAGISFLVAKKDIFHGGIMISASHNPANENGVKLFNNKGFKLDSKNEKEIEKLFYSSAPLFFQSQPSRQIEEKTYVSEYARDLANEFRDVEGFNASLVLDVANGASSETTPLILEALKIPYTLKNARPNGLNINENCGSEYARQDPQGFMRVLQSCEARYGIAFDGDADRSIVIDNQGHYYDGDSILAMLATQFASDQRLVGNSVVTTNQSNYGLDTYFKRIKIDLFKVPNGDRDVSDKLSKEGFVLGGEWIGHVINHNDHLHVTGDGMRTMLLLISELKRNPGMDLLDMAPGFRKTPHIITSIYIRNRSKIPPKDEIPGLIDLLSELSISLPDVSCECRPASTEPVYRLNLQSQYTPINDLAQRAIRIARHIQKKLDSEDLPINILNVVKGGYLNINEIGSINQTAQKFLARTV